MSEQKLTDHKCYLGNIRFIGELFKVSMLSESIIHECLADLLRASAIEGFCCLISCIGEALDKPQSKVAIIIIIALFNSQCNNYF